MAYLFVLLFFFLLAEMFRKVDIASVKYLRAFVSLLALVSSSGRPSHPLVC